MLLLPNQGKKYFDVRLGARFRRTGLVGQWGEAARPGVDQMCDGWQRTVRMAAALHRASFARLRSQNHCTHRPESSWNASMSVFPTLTPRPTYARGHREQTCQAPPHLVDLSLPSGGRTGDAGWRTRRIRRSERARPFAPRSAPRAPRSREARPVEREAVGKARNGRRSMPRISCSAAPHLARPGRQEQLEETAPYLAERHLRLQGADRASFAGPPDAAYLEPGGHHPLAGVRRPEREDLAANGVKHFLVTRTS